MSLTQEYFQHRSEIQKQYCGKGYIPLDLFLEKYKISEDQLYQCGLIADKHIISTTDIYKYDLTLLGKKYFKSLKSYQLIMLKSAQQDTLYQLLKKARQIRSENTISEA